MTDKKLNEWIAKLECTNASEAACRVGQFEDILRQFKTARIENAALKQAAVEYAKAAEASSVLIATLKEEHAIAGCEMVKAMRARDVALAELATAREELFAARARETAHHDCHRNLLAELSAANARAEKAEEALRMETTLPTHLLDVHAIADERDTANARAEKAERGARENKTLSEDGQALSELVWKNAVEGDDAYEVEDVLSSHYNSLRQLRHDWTSQQRATETLVTDRDSLRRQLEEATNDKLLYWGQLTKSREQLAAEKLDKQTAIDLLNERGTKLAETLAAMEQKD